MGLRMLRSWRAWYHNHAYAVSSCHHVIIRDVHVMLRTHNPLTMLSHSHRIDQNAMGSSPNATSTGLCDAEPMMDCTRGKGDTGARELSLEQRISKLGKRLSLPGDPTVRASTLADVLRWGANHTTSNPTTHTDKETPTNAMIICGLFVDCLWIVKHVLWIAAPGAARCLSDALTRGRAQAGAPDAGGGRLGWQTKGDAHSSILHGVHPTGHEV